MILALTLGVVLIGLMMLLMRAGAAAGSFVFDLGRRVGSRHILKVGYYLAAAGQIFVNGAYIVFVTSAVCTFKVRYPGIPSWPLWLAAFIHSFATPLHAMNRRRLVTQAQYASLRLVCLGSLVCFLLMVVTPASLHGLFGWVPLYH
jgi:hypothetical protein